MTDDLLIGAMNPLSDDELREAKEAEAKATKGPWTVHVVDEEMNGVFSRGINGGDGHSLNHGEDFEEFGEADADFIAIARNILPRLLPELQQLRQENERLKAEAVNKIVARVDHETMSRVEQLTEENELLRADCAAMTQALRDLRFGIFKDADAVNGLIDSALSPSPGASLIAEVERLKADCAAWKEQANEYSACLQTLVMTRLYPICEPVSHSWPGRKHTDCIVEAVDFLLAELKALREIEGKLKAENADMTERLSAYRE